MSIATERLAGLVDHLEDRARDLRQHTESPQLLATADGLTEAAGAAKATLETLRTLERDVVHKRDILRALGALRDGAMYARDHAQTQAGRDNARRRVETIGDCMAAVRGVQPVEPEGELRTG